MLASKIFRFYNLSQEIKIKLEKCIIFVNLFEPFIN